MKERSPTIQPERFTPLFGPDEGDPDFHPFADPNPKLKQMDPTGFYESKPYLPLDSVSRPYASSSSYDSWDTTHDSFNTPVESVGNYPSRLAEMKERGGDKLRRVLKLGGNALSRTVQIAKNLVPRRENQANTPYIQPTYEASQFYGSGFDTSYNTQPPTPDTYTSPTESIGGRLRGMINKLGNVSKSSGSELSAIYNRLPEPAQTIVSGIGFGALNGVYEGALSDYTRVNKHGKRRVKVTKVARSIANPMGAAKRAVKHGVKGARNGGIDTFSQVRSTNANINTAASFATSARDIARRFGG